MCREDVLSIRLMSKRGNSKLLFDGRAEEFVHDPNCHKNGFLICKMLLERILHLLFRIDRVEDSELLKVNRVYFSLFFGGLPCAAVVLL